jgi:cysteine-rich repeat protein
MGSVDTRPVPAAAVRFRRRHHRLRWAAGLLSITLAGCSRQGDGCAPQAPAAQPAAQHAASAREPAQAPSRATAQGGGAICGNKVVEPGEACDDGNTETGDMCPPDCRIGSCTPSQATQRVRVDVASAGVQLNSVAVLVDYPENRLNIPGTGNDLTDRQHVAGTPASVLPMIVDLEYGLRLNLAGTRPLNSPTIARVTFEKCVDAPAVTAADFKCVVLEAYDKNFQPAQGVTCTVTLEPAPPATRRRADDLRPLRSRVKGTACPVASVSV